MYRPLHMIVWDPIVRFNYCVGGVLALAANSVWVEFSNHTVTTGVAHLYVQLQEFLEIVVTGLVSLLCFWLVEPGSVFSSLSAWTRLLQLLWVVSSFKICFIPVIVSQGEITRLHFIWHWLAFSQETLDMWLRFVLRWSRWKQNPWTQLISCRSFLANTCSFLWNLNLVPQLEIVIPELLFSSPSFPSFFAFLWIQL